MLSTDGRLQDGLDSVRLDQDRRRGAAGAALDASIPDADIVTRRIGKPVRSRSRVSSVYSSTPSK
jgi:hypothetical protein